MTAGQGTASLRPLAPAPILFAHEPRLVAAGVEERVLSLDEAPTAYEYFHARDKTWTKVVPHPDAQGNGHKR
jgi:hypothetical protein